MPWLEMWLPPAAGEGAVAAGLFLDGGDAAAHGAEEAEALVPGKKAVEDVAVAEGNVLLLQEKEKEKDARAGAGALNMTKHLWAGAVAAMVSRYGRSVRIDIDSTITPPHCIQLYFVFTSLGW